eukprot:scaffold6708_cov153-Skeletonema_menzelii.AAC.5
MKLFYAVAAVALAKQASAYRVVFSNDEKYCLMVVKNDGSTDWGVDGNGNIGAIPSGSTVASDNTDDSPTVAQNGVNDPTGEILSTAQTGFDILVNTGWASGPGATPPDYTNDLAVTIYEAGGASALSSLAGLPTPSGTLSWCESYSTMAPDHYCKADGAFQPYQEVTLSTGTLQACCDSNHGGTLSMENECVKVSTGVVNRGDAEWYVDYSSNKCVRNCDADNLFDPASNTNVYTDADYSYECGGLTTWGDTWTAIADCCKNRLPSLQPDYCAYRSEGGSASPPSPLEYAGTLKWYGDASNSLCKKDCPSGADPTCGGTVTDASTTLYDSESDCCSGSLPWLPSTGCETRSAAGEGVATNIFWAAPEGCRTDCTTGANCATAPTSAVLYATADECCKNANAWVDLDYCSSRAVSTFDESSSSSTGSNNWFVDYEDGVCRQDCYPLGGTSPCEWADNGSLRFYDSSTACCKAALASNNEAACVAASDSGSTISTVQTRKWYVSTSGDQPCALDCNTSSSTGDEACGGTVSKTGVRLYESVAECCSTAYGWLNKDLCAAMSGNDGAYTDLWYVDYGANACKKDCAVGSDPACDGRPDDITTPMYTSAAACCSAKLSWIDKDTCETSSTTGVDPTDSDSPGTGEWRKNSAWSSCVLDCTAGDTIETDDPIITVQPITGTVFSDNSVAGTTVYPDQCDGVISDSSAVFYDASVSNCCKSINWVQEETCVSISTGVVSQMFFADPSDRTKCVAHQVPGTAAGTGVTVACAGTGDVVSAPADATGVTCQKDITPDTKLYSTLEKCCEANVNWDSESCVHESRGTEAPGSLKYYVDWTLSQCVQDCTVVGSGSSCKELAKKWDVLYNDANSCCERLSWLSRSKCVYIQT